MQVLSLSIDETNKLRAKLGLKPLNVNKVDAEETAEEKQQPGVLIPGDRLVHDFIHTAVKAMDVDSTYVLLSAFQGPNPSFSTRALGGESKDEEVG